MRPYSLNLRERAVQRAQAGKAISDSAGLNPIEPLFAKLKPLMRAAEQRGVEATWRKAGAILDLVSPTECADDLSNSGYAAART